MKKLPALIMSILLLLLFVSALAKTSAMGTTYTEIPYTVFNNAFGEYQITTPANIVELTVVLNNLTLAPFQCYEHADITFPLDPDCNQFMQLQYYHGNPDPQKYGIYWDDGVGMGFATFGYLLSDTPFENCTWSLNTETGIMTFLVNGIQIVNSTITDPPTTFQTIAPYGIMFHNGDHNITAATDGNIGLIITTS
jgi:hypothetical protein